MQNASWNNRLKVMLLHFNWDLKDISKITGLKYGSIRSTISRDFPKWLKVAVIVFEKMLEEREKKD